MKVAIDLGPLNSDHSVRGIGTYVKELSHHLDGVEGLDFSTRPEIVKRRVYDVLHFTSFKPFVVSLPRTKPIGVKYVVTIYDLIPLIYPSHYPPGIKGRINWEINKNLIRKNVDAIITISETSKKDICRFIGVDPKKVHVTYLAARPIFKKIIGAKYPGLPKNFVLYVGDINFNKNIPNLISACRKAHMPLVVAGKQAAQIDSMDLNHPELVHLKGLDWSDVVRLGYVSDEDLVKIYNLASVYIQPSFYEGFGLPLLEAIATQTPVAVSKNQCHVEILGDKFNYFDPNDTSSISSAIISPNLKFELPRKYSWSKTATETKKVYEKI